MSDDHSQAARRLGDPAELQQAFDARFGTVARLFRAPGRINIIGEHTDYSGGFVLPAAIDRACVVAVAPNAQSALRLVSRTLSREARVSLSLFDRRGDWTDYVAGVYFALRDAGIAVPACDILVESDVPIGAGVSSSAALEVSCVLAFAAMAGVSLGADDVARLARTAEQAFVGMPCGPMDQFIAAHGRRGFALLLDCQTMVATPARVPPKAAFLVIDSGIRHQLVDGGYKARREDCEAAARHLGLPALRDATPAMIEEYGLPTRLAKRARHVVSENTRCQQAAAALERGDLAALGVLMSASHASLCDDFEVTCPATDQLQHIAVQVEGVHGARQMGGGFGGAVLALADADVAERACGAILDAYEPILGRRTEAFVCAIADGAGEIAA